MKQQPRSVEATEKARASLEEMERAFFGKSRVGVKTGLKAGQPGTYKGGGHHNGWGGPIIQPLYGVVVGPL